MPAVGLSRGRIRSPQPLPSGGDSCDKPRTAAGRLPTARPSVVLVIFYTMRVFPRLRDHVRNVAEPLHLDAPLRRAYECVYPASRIDRIANEHTGLLLAFGLRRDSNCVDVGAHEGVILRHIVRCAPDGRHIAYEPLPQCAARLARTFPTVDVRMVALSDRSGHADFHVVVDDPMQSGLKARPDRARKERIEVVTETLDSSLPHDYVPDFIKIDVEGAEQWVLEGAIQTLSTYKPVVLFEHGAGLECEYGTSSGRVYDLLVNEAGLRIFAIDGSGPYARAEFESLYYKPTIWNFVAHR